MIAAIYIGFAVVDGRVRAIVVECVVTMAVVVVAMTHHRIGGVHDPGYRRCWSARTQRRAEDS